VPPAGNLPEGKIAAYGTVGVKGRIDGGELILLGANSYLVKPVGFDALLDLVKGLGLGLYWLMLNEDPEVGKA
jgi:hypothetical protein